MPDQVENCAGDKHSTLICFSVVNESWNMKLIKTLKDFFFWKEIFLPKNFLQQQIFFGYCGNLAKHKNEQIAFAKGTTFKNKISELLNNVFSFRQSHFLPKEPRQIQLVTITVILCLQWPEL